MKEDDLQDAYRRIAKISIDLREIHHNIFDCIPHSTSQVMYATAGLLDAIKDALAVLHSMEDE